jgi:hypothetical protein
MTTEAPVASSRTARPSWSRRLVRLFSHPAINISVGVAVVACAAVELIEDLERAGSLRGAHGILLFGAVHALRALGELGEGAHKVIHPAEELEALE